MSIISLSTEYFESVLTNSFRTSAIDISDRLIPFKEIYPDEMSYRRAMQLIIDVLPDPVLLK